MCISIYMDIMVGSCALLGNPLKLRAQVRYRGYHRIRAFSAAQAVRTFISESFAGYTRQQDVAANTWDSAYIHGMVRKCTWY